MEGSKISRMPPVRESSQHFDTSIFNVDFYAYSDDRITQVIQPTNVARDYYLANSNAIDAAFSALSNVDTADIIKKAEKVLHPVKKVIEGLDSLATLHPFVGGALFTNGYMSSLNQLTRFLCSCCHDISGSGRVRD